MNFRDNESFASLVKTREEICGTTLTQLPAETKCLVSIKALATNTGTVWLGKHDTAAAAAGSDNDNTGWPLAAGEEWPMRPLADLSEWGIISDGAATDGVVIEILR